MQGLPEEYIINQDTGELIIKSVRKDQEGIYTCEADNSAGTREAEATLTVIIKPNIERFENKTVKKNGVAVFECFSSGNPAPTITLTKVGVDYPVDVLCLLLFAI